jgi:hypothetical protein
MAHIPLVGSLKWNTSSPCMESLITWPKFVTMSFIWTLDIGNGGNGVENHAKDMWLNFMTTLTLIHNPWAI